jgi:hypothetical protein
MSTFGPAILVFIVVAAAAFCLGKWTDMLRDSDPTDFGGATQPNGTPYRRPYSLAQTQMTWWFCIVIASFVYLALEGKDLQHILTNESLILIGIGTGTALGAAAIEQTKTPPAQTPFNQLPTLGKFNEVLKQIAALPAGTPVPAALIAQRNTLAKELASEDFFRDILTDVDGVCLHRFQAVAWTVVIGIFFVYGVVSTDAFPPLGTTILGVLGISGGTYLGFKIPEVPA